MNLKEIRKILYKLYWRIQEFIVPTLKNSQYIYEDTLNNYVNDEVKWLDIGCGHQILPEWRSEEEKKLVKNSKMIVGIDYDMLSLKNHKNIFLKMRGDVENLPFRSNFFDLTTANMVVEHLKNPNVLLKEVNRILKPGGIFIFHTPNILGYSMMMARMVPDIFKNKLIYLIQGRSEEDIFDTHYKLNSRRIIHSLSVKNGFSIVKIKMSVSSAYFVMIPPVVVIELIWIRLLMTHSYEQIRTNIIAILKKNDF